MQSMSNTESVKLLTLTTVCHYHIKKGCNLYVIRAFKWMNPLQSVSKYIHPSSDDTYEH